MNPTRNNIIGSLRVFFRDFFDRHVIESFEVLRRSAKPTKAPSTEVLQTFYEGMDYQKYKVIFLFAALSGLRSSELVELTMDDIDEEKRMIVPDKFSETKQTRMSFYNEEAAQAFEEFRSERDPDDDRVFQTTKQPVNRKFWKVSEETGMKLTVQMLWRWFRSEMSRFSVDGEYIDAYCGRTPTSVLEKQYLDYSSERLKEIYEGTGFRVLD